MGIVTSHRRRKAGLARTVVASIVLGFAVTAVPRAQAGGTAVTTKFACEDPEIPVRVLTAAFPHEAAVIGRALRGRLCRYTDRAIPVTPVYFLRKLRSSPGSVEPYGYVWAIRLGGPEVVYWYFWQDAHEALLKRAPGI